MKPLNLDSCRIIDLPKIPDPRGNLTFIEGENHVPFLIKRVYYLYNVPPETERGAHAHKGLSQIIIAIFGSCSIVLDDGRRSSEFNLCRPDQGLYVCPMIWREMNNFSSGTVCLVLASDFYDESDYIRNYRDFQQALEVP